MTITTKKCAVAMALCMGCSAMAADWSDTSLSLRYGTQFREPGLWNADGSATDISKTIISVTHMSGYRFGSQFFNLNLLQSDRSDPAGGVVGKTGAQEAYLHYRHTLDLGRLSGKDLAWGLVRSVGITGTFDWNTKNDGYGSKKRAFGLGPTLSFNVPGALDLSLLAIRDSNAPNVLNDRYHYKTIPALLASFAIPLGGLPLSFEGYALYLASYGRDEFGANGKPETHIDAQLMWDAGATLGMAQRTLRVGLQYEYWRNKFGKATTQAFQGAGPGATARTPMIRVQYHF